MSTECMSIFWRLKDTDVGQKDKNGLGKAVTDHSEFDVRQQVPSSRPDTGKEVNPETPRIVELKQ